MDCNREAALTGMRDAVTKHTKADAAYQGRTRPACKMSQQQAWCLWGLACSVARGASTGDGVRVSPRTAGTCSMFPWRLMAQFCDATGGSRHACQANTPQGCWHAGGTCGERKLVSAAACWRQRRASCSWRLTAASRTAASRAL